jgi:hypothetical protein
MSVCGAYGKANTCIMRVLNSKHRTESIRQSILKDFFPSNYVRLAVEKFPSTSNWAATTSCPDLNGESKCNLTRFPRSRIEIYNTSDGEAYLFLKGTRFTSAHDLFQDARLMLSKAHHPLEGRVHSGFHALYKRVYPVLQSVIERLNIKKLTIVGVSMGGAISLMLAMSLKKDYPKLIVNLITALLPPVGNKKFMSEAQALNDQIHFVAKSDIVSSLHLKKSAANSLSLRTARKLLRTLGYHPLGESDNSVSRSRNIRTSPNNSLSRNTPKTSVSRITRASPKKLLKNGTRAATASTL